MLNKDGYSHEIITDKDGRVWLKPTVTVVYSIPGPDIDTTELAKRMSDDVERILSRKRRKVRTWGWMSKRRDAGEVA